jgi:predicted DNA-binding ribbon-helix-helix protein
MAKKSIKSISMDDAFYRKIRKQARKKHMSASGWLASAAEEKLDRELRAEEESGDYKTKKK